MTDDILKKLAEGASKPVRIQNTIPGIRGAFSRPIADRFWEKVDRRGPDECWPWIGANAAGGYGTLGDGKLRRRATQVSWEIANGRPFPAGLMACHSCDNPPCVNPAHIWPGTMSENLADAVRKGRTKNWVPPRTVERSHCWAGHPYEGDNLFIRRNGSRGCHACRVVREARRLRTRVRDQSRSAREARLAASVVGGK